MEVARSRGGKRTGQNSTAAGAVNKIRAAKKRLLGVQKQEEDLGRESSAESQLYVGGKTASLGGSSTKQDAEEGDDNGDACYSLELATNFSQYHPLAAILQVSAAVSSSISPSRHESNLSPNATTGFSLTPNLRISDGLHLLYAFTWITLWFLT